MATDALQPELGVELIEACGPEIVFHEDFFEATGLARYAHDINQNMLLGLDPRMQRELQTLSLLAVSALPETPWYVDGLIHPQTDRYIMADPDSSKKTFIDRLEPFPAISTAYFVGFAVRRVSTATCCTTSRTYPPDLYLALSFVPEGLTNVPFGIPLYDRLAYLRPADT